MPEAKSLNYKKPAGAPRDPPVTPRGDRSASAASAAALRRVDEELQAMDNRAGMTRERTRERVLEAIGQGLHGPYDPRVVGAVDYLLDRLAELDGRSNKGAVADARSRSPRRDHSTTHHGHSNTTTTRPLTTHPWVPRVIIQTSADGETHTTILR
mgnify:CR=1 FL=1